jgi:hypothetical protein
MKNQTKKIFALITVLLTVTMSLGLVANANAANEPQPNCALSLDPATVGTPLHVGDTFTMSLKIANVAGLWGWKVGLQWDPAMLEMVYPPGPASGGFITGALFTAAPPNNATGVLLEMAEYPFSSTEKTGSGTLATFEFKIVGYGTSTISITDVELKRWNDDVIIPGTVQGSTFSLPPPPATAPTAKFNVTDGAYYYVGTHIVIDASSSLPGFDTLPAPGHNVPITAYGWQITGAFSNLNINGAIASFDASAVGDIIVQLTVTAPDQNPPTAASYVDTNSVTKTLHIIAVPTGADIDVYTQRGGQFSMVPSDAFGPQELIQLYAKVTYNGAPVAGKDVAFQVVNARGESIAYRTGRTNIDGIATAEYRLPWPYPNPETEFGTWTIVGIVDVSQVVKHDNCSFTFGYIVQITQVRTLNTDGTTPQSTFARGNDMMVEVQLNNIRTTGPVNVRVTITLYDNANVPIAVMTFQQNNLAPGLTTATAQSLNIPSWAFVGVATVYVNAFTALPSQGGVPYCPETTSVFTIAVP